jgi:multidrug efflux system outer membrane protein
MPLNESRLRLIVLAGAAVMFAGCTTVGPDFVRPSVPWLDHWTEGSLQTLAADPRRPRAGFMQEWWRNFNDPVLDQLVAEAQRVNPSVRIAGLRIMEARAQLGIADATRYPQVQQVSSQVLGGAERRSGGSSTHALTANIALNAGWEIDFWGKFRRSIESADAAYLASIAHYDDMQVLMAAQAASLYCSIRTAELRLRIAIENAELQRRSLQITELHFKSGNESELDVQQARAQYLGTLSIVPQLEIVLRQSQNAPSALLARPPGPLPEMNERKAQIPQAELGVIVDLPANLLRRRPDVRAAELQMAAQSALIGVSVAELYPSISLLGSLGLSATSISGSPRILSAAIGPGLVWNVFDHGRLANSVLLQDARFQQLYEQYQDTVLRSAREVDDASIAFAKSGEQIVLLSDAVQAAKRSLQIADRQYNEGLVDFQRVLDSQRVLFSEQDQLVASRGSQSQSLIAVYKAMGGGWESARSRPILDEKTQETMERRSDWKGMLAVPLPRPDADALTAPEGTTP